MKTIAILDTDATGADPSRDQCIEVACILYSLEHRIAFVSYASLLQLDTKPGVAFRHFPVEVLRGAAPASQVWDSILRMVQSADAIVAHHAAFDRRFVRADVRDAKPWLCSKNDIDWPFWPTIQARAQLSAHLDALAMRSPMAQCETLMRAFQLLAEQGVDVAELLTQSMGKHQ